MICVSKADMKMIVVKVVKMMAMVVMAMDVCLLSLKTINPFAMLLCTSQPAHQPASPPASQPSSPPGVDNNHESVVVYYGWYNKICKLGYHVVKGFDIQML
jgi:hypothetical protein